MAGDADQGAEGSTPKPAELVEIANACDELFDRLRRWFDVGPVLKADLSTIDSPTAIAELHSPQLIAAFTMRRLQALHHVAHPGVPTTVDVVVHNIDAVLRALLEAPGRHLAGLTERVDWDQEWATLDSGMLLPEGCPQSETEAYRDNVERLIAARQAVTGLARVAGGSPLVLT